MAADPASIERRAEAELAQLRDAKSRNPDPAEPVPKDRKRISFVPVGELVSSSQPPAWQIRKILEADSLAVVYGAPESGKSFLVIDWACCAVAGIEWCGYKVKQGPVLMIVGEGRNGYSRRLAAWSKTHRRALHDLPMYVSTMATALTHLGARRDLEEVIGEFMAEHGAPVMVVIDTLARNFGPGDENSTSDMTAAISTCDAVRALTGAAVILVHHAGKDTTKGARGSMALRGAIDCEYLLVRDADHLVRVEATKMKDAERPEPMAFRFHSVGLGFDDEEGEEVTSAVLAQVDYAERVSAAKAQPAGGKHQRRALELLRTQYEKHRENVRKSGRPEAEARVSQEIWRDVCIDDGMPPNRFNDARRTLVNVGKVRAEFGFVYLAEPTP